jgi:Kef-type K+ transport system membrane component KefB
MLTLVRKLIDRILPWILRWSGRILAFCIAFTFFCAAITEWIGIHALFGAMVAGITIGDSKHFKESTRAVIEKFVTSFFAPIFFAGVGLKVDFISHFSLSIFIIVFLVACFGKIVGCGLAARFSGMNSKDAWGVGFAMNARGAMEIILGILALQYGLIGEQLYVALILMALLTSVIAGPGLLFVTQELRNRDKASLVS